MSVSSTFLLSFYLSLVQIPTADTQDCQRIDTVYVLYAGTESELYNLYGLNNEFPRELSIDVKNSEKVIYSLSHNGATEVFESVSDERYDIAESELNKLNLFSIHDLYIKAAEIRECVFDAAREISGVYPDDNNRWYFNNVFLILPEDDKLIARKVIWW
jgi:hypothetical protein